MNEIHSCCDLQSITSKVVFSVLKLNVEHLETNHKLLTDDFLRLKVINQQRYYEALHTV